MPPALVAAGKVTLASLNLSSNIKPVAWAPQSDVLGHPSVKAFITQGGINSLYEAMHNAVPVGVIPLVADQPFNLRQVGPPACREALAACKLLNGTARYETGSGRLAVCTADLSRVQLLCYHYCACSLYVRSSPMTTSSDAEANAG